MMGQTEAATEEIGVAELAEARRSSKRATRRWLAAIERRHPGVVARRAGRMVTTGEQIGPHIERPAPPPSKTTADLRRLRDRVDELERRADAHACELAEFRRQSNAWFRNGRK